MFTDVYPCSLSLWSAAQDRSNVSLLKSPDDFRAQPVGGGLQRGDVVDSQEGIVVFAEADLRPLEFLFDEAVAVKIVGGLEGEEGGHTHHYGAENFIADVEVIMREAAALVGKDAVVRVLGGIFRHADAEGSQPSIFVPAMALKPPPIVKPPEPPKSICERVMASSRLSQ
jgi:hypothetical protein